jgi:hypothetical protein
MKKKTPEGCSFWRIFNIFAHLLRLSTGNDYSCDFSQEELDIVDDWLKTNGHTESDQFSVEILSQFCDYLDILVQKIDALEVTRDFPGSQLLNDRWVIPGDITYIGSMEAKIINHTLICVRTDIKSGYRYPFDWHIVHTDTLFK